MTCKDVIKLAAIATAVSAMPSAAYAAEANADTGVYFAAKAGLATLDDPKLPIIDSSFAPSLTIDTKLHTKSAAGFGGEIGYDFGNIRFGVELRYQRNKVNGVTIRSVNGTAFSGPIDQADAVDFVQAYLGPDIDPNSVTTSGTTINSKSALAKIRQLGVMGNIYYDVPLGAFEPYVGVGLGLVGTHVQAPDESEGSVRFAWQLLAGAAYKITPKIAITAEYSYRQGAKSKLKFDDDDLIYKLGKTKSQFLGVGVRAGF